ncbi:MAG: hypothetical protein MK299_09285 [Pseudomonadales bacterium]|nr:hypothetical protein [Pseudomonadales bacterium]
MRSKLIYIIFVVSLLMAGILLAIGLAEPVTNASGGPHPEFPGMQIGGDGIARIEQIGNLGFAFQCLLLILIVLLSLLGISERYRSRHLLVYMSGTTFLTLFIAWQMYSSHLQYLETGNTGYFLGFPIATAWAVYGTWLGAIPLVILYSVGFHKYIYTPEDEKQYKKLLIAKADKTEQADRQFHGSV